MKERRARAGEKPGCVIGVGDVCEGAAVGVVSGTCGSGVRGCGLGEESEGIGRGG